MSPLILLLFTTEYHNIMMNSTCSVVYLSPLHTSFMQVFFGLLTLLPIFLNWTPKSEEKFFHQKRESFNSLSGLNKVSKLVFLWTEYFFLERNSTFLENTPSKNKTLKNKSLSEKTLSESTLFKNTLSEINFQIIYF